MSLFAHTGPRNKQARVEMLDLVLPFKYNIDCMEAGQELEGMQYSLSWHGAGLT